jgi:sarcosine oxidase subunit delta
MRLTCPFCGDRDRREFTYLGSADWLHRPAADAPPGDWDGYLHLRDNPAGETEDLWYHEGGCAQWLRVRRDTVSHAVHAVAPVLAPAAAQADRPAADAVGGGTSAKKKKRRAKGGTDAP